MYTKFSSLLLLLIFYGPAFSLANYVSPIKTNVVLVLDTKTNSIHLVEKIIDSLSLLKYRPAVSTVFGFSQPVHNFETRECVLNKLRSEDKLKRQDTLSVLKHATDELKGVWEEDDNIVIYITDTEKLDPKIVHFLKKFEKDTQNEGLYIINVGTGNFGEHQLKIIKSRSTHAIVKQMKFLDPDLKTCNVPNGGSVRDECERECRCDQGQMVQCARVRREFSDLSLAERKRYVSAFVQFSRDPRFADVYNGYCKIHHVEFMRGVHQRPQFFPWHRKFMVGFESKFRVADCRLTLPAWNWAYFSKMPWKRAPEYHQWDIDGGLGSNGGDVTQSFCVKEGEFSPEKFQAPKYEDHKKVISDICLDNKECHKDFTENPTHRGCLRRNFDCELPSHKALVGTIMHMPLHNFTKFEQITRVMWHNQIHNCVGGHMRTTYASNTPEFWMHHVMIDSIWDAWQQRGEKFKWVGYRNVAKPLLHFPTEQRNNFIDNDHLGCGVRVKYHDAVKIGKTYPYSEPEKPDNNETEEDDENLAGVARRILKESANTPENKLLPHFRTEKRDIVRFLKNIVGEDAFVEN